ncbi:ATP-binding protein [Pseudoalteromonas sp. SSDWG2]|uniref:sensor histidine kinase n=1 Tax=Pseudoalteromonas sp. SSDWG2 TaxID=3139391 RepID=UPI003BADBA14
MQARVHEHQRAIDKLVIYKNELLSNRDAASVSTLEQQIASYWQYQIQLDNESTSAEEKLLVTDLKNNLGTYITQLNSLIEAIKTLGLNENSGLRGEFRSQIHRLRTLAAKEQNQELVVQILEMRRREKDYLLRFDDTYLDLHRQHFDNILVLVKEQNVENAAILVNKYGQIFSDVVALYNRLGTTPNEGLRAQLSEQEAKIELSLQRFSQGFTQSRVDEALLANALVLTLVATVAIMLLFFLHLVSKRTAQSLSKLHEQIARVMHEEDFSFRTALHGDDEISRLGRDIDSLFAFIDELLQRLGEAQDKLIEEAKMASLGSMVSGFAHELNTPIGVAITSQSVLKDQFSLLKHDFQAGKLRKHTLSNLIANAERSLVLLESNLNRSAQLIEHFKMIADFKEYNQITTFAVKDHIQSILMTFTNDIRQEDTNIALDIDDDLQISASVSAFSQVVSCCVRNCLHHARVAGQVLNIVIRVTVQSNDIHIFIDDNGPGLDEQLKARAYEPFMTTKRGEGSKGLGLTIVYNLVRNALKGQITLHNLEPQGLRVHITFTPAKAIEAQIRIG